jgi:multiple sugar transport system permease protein/N,N'-diacetylchitobiose transport system permease protein
MVDKAGQRLAVPQRSGFREPSETTLAWLLVLPSLAVILGVKLYPLLYSIWLSGYRVTVLSPVARYVGTDNYVALLTNPNFQASLGRTLYFTVVSLILQMALGIAIALVLNTPFRGRNLVRALVLLPWAVPTVVNAVLWQWIYHPQFGALNGILSVAGIIDSNIQWLGSPYLAMNMVILADTWKTLPLYVILFLAALQTVPDELHQAAAVDGAGLWKRFVHVTLPFLKPTMVVVLVLRTMETFRVFDIIFLMTAGGPAGSTTVVGYYAYLEAFRNLNFGAGAAASNIIVFAVALISLVYLRLLRTRAFE